MRFLGLAVFLFATSAAAFDVFSDEVTPHHFVFNGDAGLTLQLKGSAKVSVRDLQGEGGLGRDSATDTATLGTRSLHAHFDGVDLAFRLSSDVGIGFRFALAISNSVRPIGVLLDYSYTYKSIKVTTEIGLGSPIVARHIRMAREPLGSRIYWGGQELHVVASIGNRGRQRWWVSGSVAMMRPLQTRLVNDATDAGTIVVLSYGDARVYSGIAPVVGGLVGGALGSISLDIFGFVGALAAEGGIDELRNRFTGYPNLPGHKDGDPRDQDPSFYWGGSRVTFKRDGVSLIVAGIASRESLLTRHILSAEAGYTLILPGPLLRTMEVRALAEHYRLHQGVLSVGAGRALRGVAPSQAISWDYDSATMGVASDVYLDVVRLAVEYTWLNERNGAPALGIADVPLRNDELIARLFLRF